MKIIYAFSPLEERLTNISAEVLKRLGSREKYLTKIFPAKFNKHQFLELLSVNPESILGLGQYPRGKQVRIERKAINLFGRKKVGIYKPIVSDGPKHLFASYKLHPTERSRISYFAGRYVCNFSYYHLLLATKKTATKVGFIHIPKSMKVDEAVREITQIVEKQPTCLSGQNQP